MPDEARTFAVLQLLYPYINRFNCRFVACLEFLFVGQLVAFLLMRRWPWLFGCLLGLGVCLGWFFVLLLLCRFLVCLLEVLRLGLLVRLGRLECLGQVLFGR